MHAGYVLLARPTHTSGNYSWLDRRDTKTATCTTAEQCKQRASRNTFNAAEDMRLQTHNHYVLAAPEIGMRWQTTTPTP